MCRRGLIVCEAVVIGLTELLWQCVSSHVSINVFYVHITFIKVDGNDYIQKKLS